MKFAAYIHPAFQIATLSLGLITLANGLRVRRSRKGGAGPDTARVAACTCVSGGGLLLYLL